MLREVIPGYELAPRPLVCPQGEHGQAMESFHYLGGLWALFVQQKYALQFMWSLHGKKWTQGLRFVAGSPNLLGLNQQLMRAAPSRHAAILQHPFNHVIRYGALWLNRDRGDGEQRR